MDTTPERPSKRRANFPTPTLESTTINDDKEEALIPDNNLEISINFENDTPLTPQELLFYALITITFHTFSKTHPSQKYNIIQSFIHITLGIKYTIPSMRHYFQKARDKPKYHGFFNKRCRWNYFADNIRAFISQQETEIAQIKNALEKSQEPDVNCLISLEAGLYANIETTQQDSLSQSLCIDRICAIFKSQILSSLKYEWTQSTENAKAHFYKFQGYLIYFLMASKT